MSNPNSLPWLHYQDVQIPDASLREQFDYLMLNREYDEAIALLRSEQLEGKSYVADCVLKIIKYITELQKYFNNGVNLYLSDLANAYFLLVDELKNKNAWNDITLYKPYNFVYYKDDVYMALLKVPQGVFPTNTKYWLKLGLKGENGVPGVNVTMKYAWDKNKRYSLYDLVAYKGSLYVALKVNNNVIPGTDESTWLTFLLVQKGEIFVSKEEPKNPIQNLVWFKTEVNPLTASSAVSGEFFRRTSFGTWEMMYPATIFTWIEGTQNYAPKSVVDNITISIRSWRPSQLGLVYTYYNGAIKKNSKIEIIPGAKNFTENQRKIYSAMRIIVSPDDFNSFVLLIPWSGAITLPDLPLTIQIQ